MEEANFKAAEYFVDEYDPEGDYCTDPSYEVTNNGTLLLTIRTDGSTGGLVTVYTKPGVVGRATRGR